MKLKRPRYCMETLKNVLFLDADDPKELKQTWSSTFGQWFSEPIIFVKPEDKHWKKKREKKPWE